MDLSGKHLFGSIEDTRVTFIEKKIEKERIDFLKQLLKSIVSGLFIRLVGQISFKYIYS